MRKHLLWFVFFIGLLTSQHTIQAQEDVGYLRYDTHIFLEEDGSFIVMEIQQLQFNGAFHNGFAEIPLDYVVGIEDITVAGGSDLDSLTPYQLNGGGPNSYTTERDGDVIYVDWEFPETQPGDTLTFTLQYKVLGGLWVYPQTDTLEWRAVPAERGFPVPASWVVVNLPFTVATDALDYTAFGPASTVETIETETGQQIVFNAAEPIPDGVAFQVLVDFPHGLVAAEPQAWQIAADTAVLAYSLDNIDVEMVVGEDGRLHIAERRQVTIQEGVMYGGYREISWLYLDGVGDVSLAEGDAVFTFVPDAAPLCDYCAQTMTEARYSRWAQYSEWQDRVTISDDWAGQTAVRWQFPPLVKGETTTFTLEYTVDGAISVNEDNQRLSWTVVPEYETAVGETAVHLQLPGDMGLEDIAIEGGAVKREGGAILITPEQPPQADEAWQIAIDLPPEATTAVKPDWQSDLEAAYAQAEAARARQAQRELTWLVVKIITAVFALLGLLVGWYLWGSRKAREIMGNYRTLPPSDLSPGIVAYLVDKEATARSALASLLHLASLGWIRVNPGQTLTLQRVREGLVTSGQEVTTPDGRHVKAPDHAATLYNALLPAMPRGEAIPLSAITPAFQKVLPKMYAAMGGEMAAHFYGDGRLSEDGRQTKRDQLARFMPMLGMAGSAIFAFSMISGQRSRPFGSFDAPNPFVMIVGFFGPFFLGIILAQYLSRPKSALTKLGAKEAARWRGFGAYLQEIQKYGSLEEAQAILERYFAYAVALGVDERFVAEVKALGGRIPGWIGGGELDDGRSWQNESISTTTAVPRWRQLVQQGSWRPRPAAPATTAAPPTPSAPGLEMLSGRLTDSLSSASQRMTTMLNTAIGVADGDAKNGQPVKVTLRTGGRKVEMEWQPGTSADKMVGEIMRKAEATRPPRPASGSGSGGYRGGGSSGGFGGGSRSSGRRSGRSSSRSSGSRRSGGGGRRGFR